MIGRPHYSHYLFMASFLNLFFILVDCQDPTCSSHGFCVSGTCVCRKGWRGVNCDLVDDDEKQCLPDCSAHGAFDIELGKCICHQGFMGDACNIGK